MDSAEKPEAGNAMDLDPTATGVQTEGSDTAKESTVTYDGKEYSIVKEGLASILVPPSKGKEGPQQVFYNPIQQFNRDLSVLAIKAFQQVRAEEKASAGKEKTGKKRKREGPGNGEKEAKAIKATDDSSPQAVEKTDAPEDATPEDTSVPEAPSVSKSEQKQDAPKKPNFSILDALSASGLRALRYAHELPLPATITANDLTASAVESIKLNVKHNGLQDKISVSHDDALAHMYRRLAEDLSKRDRHGNPSQSLKYDVIDLDPYGTAAPFFDAAVQSVKEGGMLSVTCTDSAVWAGHCYCEKSYALYGGIPVKGFYSHEAGLRLVLHAIASAASRHGLTIEPLLSVSADFYLRVFVRVRKSQAALKFLAAKTMVVYNCDQGCGAWETQYLMRAKPVKGKKGGAHYKHIMAQAPACDVFCDHCGTKMHLAGPMYGGYIHSPPFVQRILDGLSDLDREVYGTIPRIQGVLQTALEEVIAIKDEDTLPVPEKDKEAARVDPAPFYFSTSLLARSFRASAPGEDLFRGALKHLGWAVTRSHCKPGSLKTDAPFADVVFAMREWVKQRAPVTEANIKKGSPVWRMLGLGSSGDKGGDGGSGADEKAESPKAEDDRYVDEAAAKREELRRTLVYDENLEKLGKEKKDRRLVRYQLNPRENWGPMSRARGN
ncbi:related to N2,N2-dimethylguanosine tRNA methyltransferase [Cephalotrichum gorgonifer]|uniref:tRNA (guanine(26)-N(2))-dimethyltransferase n=1 Tax=Cephalotrichum gorgonifer TaxID=2041049 RepID=A0AAE8MSF2_9PEZI|nr:related to N2,N2-dimethylguanosine tRNA methyltransferase [Cephalotrichum gorgonifer]